MKFVYSTGGREKYYEAIKKNRALRAVAHPQVLSLRDRGAEARHHHPPSEHRPARHPDPARLF